MSVLPAFLSSVLGPVRAHRPTEAPSGTFVLADCRLVSRSPERMHLRYGPLLLIPVLALVFFFELLLHPSWVLYSDFSDLLAYQAPKFLFSMCGLIGPPPAGLLPTMSWEYRTGW